MLPLLAGAAGAAGMKLAQGAFNNDDEEAKKRAAAGNALLTG